jgi:hypothetical protein
MTRKTQHAGSWSKEKMTGKGKIKILKQQQ